METIESYLALAIEEGATVFAGGARSAAAGLAKGHFVQPTIFNQVAHDMRIAQEEIYGPVNKVKSSRAEDEMLARANYTVYGTDSGVWPRALAIAHLISKA